MNSITSASYTLVNIHADLHVRKPFDTRRLPTFTDSCAVCKFEQADVLS